MKFKPLNLTVNEINWFKQEDRRGGLYACREEYNIPNRIIFTNDPQNRFIAIYENGLWAVCQFDSDVTKFSIIMLCSSFFNAIDVMENPEYFATTPFDCGETFDVM
jgi:hypothetical protein